MGTLLATVMLSVSMGVQSAYVAEFWTVACRDKEFMEDLVNAYRDRDTEAVEIAIMAALLSDECAEIEKGQRVSVHDVGFFSPLHEIRIRGQLGRYYVIAGLFERVR